VKPHYFPQRFFITSLLCEYDLNEFCPKALLGVSHVFLLINTI
jgi:hypothetical protein